MASSLLAIEPEPRPVHLQAQPTSDIGKLFSNGRFGKQISRQDGYIRIELLAQAPAQSAALQLEIE
jgi:hypothetical protein